MPWEFDSNKPIYMQIVNEIKIKIIAGHIAKGSKLDSVRDLSAKAGVNPNTMQRALAELEKEELVYSQRTTGRYVTEDEALIHKIRDEYAKEKIQEAINDLSKLGYENKELLSLIKSYLGELN
jgi:DNA-binding transcriptional regulator YhcF (GntR family)